MFPCQQSVVKGSLSFCCTREEEFAVEVLRAQRQFSLFATLSFWAIVQQVLLPIGHSVLTECDKLKVKKLLPKLELNSLAVFSVRVSVSLGIKGKEGEQLVCTFHRCHKAQMFVSDLRSSKRLDDKTLLWLSFSLGLYF